MKYTQGRTWNIARNSEKHEKCEIHKQDLGYGNKTEKWGKRHKKHCFSWIMGRKLKNVEDEKLTWEDY